VIFLQKIKRLFTVNKKQQMQSNNNSTTNLKYKLSAIAVLIGVAFVFYYVHRNNREDAVKSQLEGVTDQLDVLNEQLLQLKSKQQNELLLLKNIEQNAQTSTVIESKTCPECKACKECKECKECQECKDCSSDVDREILKRFIDNAVRDQRIYVRTRTVPSFTITVPVESRESLALPIIRETFQWGIYDYEKVELFRRVLVDRPSCQVIDIGANIGTFSLLSASLGHKVEAFEVFSTNAKAIATSIKLNNFEDKIKLNHRGVSDNDANMLVVGRCNGNGNCQVRPISKEEGKNNPDAVPLVRLDDALKHIDSVCLLKVDVEGHEVNLLKGAEEFFKRVQPEFMIFEFIPESIQIFKQNPLDLLEFFNSLGYMIWDNTISDSTLITSDNFQNFIDNKLKLDLHGDIILAKKLPKLADPLSIYQSRYYEHDVKAIGDTFPLRSEFMK
jgi:FkbM family methyltransferase